VAFLQSTAALEDTFFIFIFLVVLEFVNSGLLMLGRALEPRYQPFWL
jgi:hypothetical protein